VADLGLDPGAAGAAEGTATPAPAPAPFDLAAFLAARRLEVEASLARALDHLLPRLPEPLRAPVRQGVTTGGKRLRPILCVEAFHAAQAAAEGEGGGTGTSAGAPMIGGTQTSAGEALLDLAASLELIHAYSLMHDDLPCMDDAPLRRGLPTPHVTHGVPATTLGGAALIPAAGLWAWEAAGRLGTPDPVRRELVRTLARAAGGGGMVGGQALDLEGEGRALQRTDLDALHRAKTGALLTAALRMGGLAAGAPPARLAALEAYGRAVGLAFQVADDILDATATAEALGKEPSDAALDKSTYVRLLGVEGARAEAARLVESALAHLAASATPSPALEALARYVVEREH
jgi:geranylgeranyl pyrophosphate synthase